VPTAVCFSYQLADTLLTRHSQALKVVMTTTNIPAILRIAEALELAGQFLFLQSQERVLTG